MTRPQRGWLAALALAVVAALFGVRIHNLLVQGQPVFWLAELWAPAAMLSIGLVTCIEFFLTAPEKAAGAPVPGARKVPAAKKRRK